MGINTLLGLGREALITQNYGLNVSGQNLTNANTPGYVRRQALIETWAAQGQPFGGTRAVGQQRLADLFLQTRMYEATGFSSAADSRDQALERVESLVNDVAGSGLASSIQALFGSFSSLAAHPTDPTVRSTVLARAQDFAGGMRNMSNALTQQRQDLLDQSKDVATQINDIASQIAKLNTQIAQAKNAGGDGAADLQDEQGRLLQKLAEQVDIHTVTDDTGQVVVYAAGSALIEKDKSAQLSIGTAPDGSMQLFSTRSGGSTVELTSQLQGGKLGGLRQSRDEDIVETMQKLDQLTTDIASAINTQHAAGFGQDSSTGNALFTFSAPPGSAASITLNAAMLGHPERVAAASSLGSLPSGADNANLLNQLFSKPIASGGTRTAAEAYSDLVGDVATKKAAAERETQVRSAMQSQIKSVQDSASGVSLNEEFVSLTSFQRGYEAAAKLIKTADELLQLMLK